MIQDIIICILFLLIIYNLLKKKQENFSVPDVENLDSYIQTNINDNYKEKINNLDIILNFINQYNINNNNFKINSKNPIPVKDVVVGNLKTIGNQNFKNMTINGDLKINGGLKINYNEGRNKIDIVPRYMIVAWTNNFYKRVTIIPEDLENGIIEGVNDKKIEAVVLDIPKGWVICDGSGYIINENGDIIRSTNANAIITPDLRDRFVIGACEEFSYTDLEKVYYRKNINTNFDIIYISKYEFGKIYGNYSTRLTSKNIPVHDHEYTYYNPIKLPFINPNTSINDNKLIKSRLQNYSYGNLDLINEPEDTVETCNNKKISLLRNRDNQSQFTSTVNNISDTEAGCSFTPVTKLTEDGNVIDGSKFNIVTGINTVGFNMGEKNTAVYVETEDAGNPIPKEINTVPWNMSLFYIMKI